MPMEQLSERVSSLMAVLPDVDNKLTAMQPALVVKLACRVHDVATKLVLLKQSFPAANVAEVVLECQYMLLLELEQFETAVGQAALLLSSAADPSALLNSAPILLDPKVLTSVLDEVRRLFGATAQPLVLLQQNPGLAYTCQSLHDQARGDRDVDYLGDIFAVGQQGKA